MELNVQRDHLHLVVMVTPEVSIYKSMGIVKGRTATKVSNKFRAFKKNPIGKIYIKPEAIALIL